MGRSALTYALAERSKAIGGVRGGGGVRASRARIPRADDGDERFPAFRMQAALEEAELLISAAASRALGLLDVADARLGEELCPALREGATCQAPLDGTRGAQRVFVAG